MSLLSPWWLAALLLGALVVFLHRRRPRSVTVPSLYLWRRLTSGAAQSRSSRVRPNPLMWLQLLALALLVVALAEPIGSAFRRAPVHWFYVVDVSGSMQVEEEPTVSRMEASLAQLADRLRGAPAEWGRTERYSLIAADSPAQPLAVAHQSPDLLLDALDLVTPSHAPADWDSVASLITRSVRGDEEVRLVVFTDPAGASEMEPLGEWSASGALEMNVVGETPPVNLALSSFTAESTGEDGGTRLLSGSVVSAGSADHPVRTEVTISYRPVGAADPLELTSRTVELDDAGRGEFEFELRISGEGLLEARLPGDALPHDDVGFARIAVDRNLRVLLVGGGEGVERALKAAAPDVDLVIAPELPENAGEFDLVIVNRPDVADHPGTNTLWLSGHPSAAASARLGELEPDGWREDHPLSAAASWHLLEISSALRFDRLPGASVLVEAADAPLVQARTTEFGREVLVAFDLEASNWQELSGFPSFFSNLIAWAVDYPGTCRIGEFCPLDPRLLDEMSGIIDPNGHEVVLPAPIDDSGPDWYPNSLTPGFYPRLTGVHAYRGGGSLPLVVGPDTLEESLLEAEGAAAATAGMPSGGQAPAFLPPPGHYSKWLLAAALLVLTVESVLYRRLKQGGAATGGGRSSLSGVLRLVAMGSVVLALMGVPILLPAYNGFTVLVSDRSGEVSNGAQGELGAFTKALLEGESRVQRVAVLEVANQDAFSKRFDDRPQTQASEPGGGGGDLSQSLSLAVASIPGGTSGRVVVASPGSTVPGALYRALPQLRQRGLAVDVLPLTGMPEGDASVESLRVPPVLHEDEPFELEVIILSELDTDVLLTVDRQGETTVETVVGLGRGSNRVTVPMSAGSAGVGHLRVSVSAAGDPVPENDTLLARQEVIRALRVAVVTPQAEWGEELARALDLQGMNPVVLTPSQAPFYLGHANEAVEGWLDYDVAVLMNVPALDLTWLQQQRLQTWVSEHGGGLVVMGGENTFGPGGYYETVLEEIMPLSTKIPQDRPEVAMVFVLDRSGSMGQSVGSGATRLDVVKEATLTAAELLTEGSLVGIVAFDSEAFELRPLAELRGMDELAGLLSELQPGGGTAIHPGLELAFEGLRGADPELTRHIVVMTDGLSQQADFSALLEEIRDAGITVSTAAVGRTADAQLVQSIARMGGGAAHVTSDFEALPSILAQEALLLNDEPLVTESFTPRWVESEREPAEGLPSSLPDLHGYVLATAKPTATLHLVGPDDDPLMASWRYGLGRVVAFASHGAGPWASDWLHMPEYPRLWAQFVRWTSASSAGERVRISGVQSGPAVELTVEARDHDGAPLQGLDLEAQVEGPTEEVNARLVETRAGSYSGEFVPAVPGEYRIEVVGGGESIASGIFYVNDRQEWRYGKRDGDLLVSLAAQSGGRVVGSSGPAEVAASLRWHRADAWQVWVAAAGVAFLAGLLVRHASFPARGRIDPSGSEVSRRWRRQRT